LNEGINLVLPIRYDSSDGPYKTTKSLKDAVKQNLKTLFKCGPGERMMDLNFGIGIQRFLFETYSDSVAQELRSVIKVQVNRYLPFIGIQDIYINKTKLDHQIYIKFSYIISGIGGVNIFEYLATN
jgi:phage baseplate assembly protein W